MSKSIPELLHEASCMSQDLRELAAAHMDDIIMPGYTEEERKDVVTRMVSAEGLLLEIAVELHAVTGVMLTASVRWLAKEQAGQDPTVEETKQ